MGFLTPMHKLDEYLVCTRSDEIRCQTSSAATSEKTSATTVANALSRWCADTPWAR